MNPALKHVVAQVKQVVAETLTDTSFFFHRGDKIIQRRRPVIGKKGTSLYFPLVEVETEGVILSQEEAEQLDAIRNQVCDAIFAAFNIHGGYVGLRRYMEPRNLRKVYLEVAIPDYVVDELN